MKVTEEMLTAAVKKAVETGLLPGRVADAETFIKNCAQVKKVLQSALDVVMAPCHCSSKLNNDDVFSCHPTD